ncbi:MAG: hypothetical protein ACAI44_10050 [Candidatus Sericytochromatia bacterium]
MTQPDKTRIDEILAQIQALSPHERDQLFERLADFEALRLRRAVQYQKERLSSQADAENDAANCPPEQGRH